MDAICGKGWRVDKQEAGKHRNEGALLLQSVATRLYHTQSWTREEGALLHHFETFDKDRNPNRSSNPNPDACEHTVSNTVPLYDA